MNYQELTPRPVGRYDGYMDPNTTSEQSSTPEVSVNPAPLSDAMRGKDLMQRAENGTETNVAPKSAETDAMPYAREKLAKEKKLTRDALKEISQTVQNKASPAAVLADASVVYSAAKILVENMKADVKNFDVNKSILDELEKNNIEKQAKEIKELIEKTKANGQTQENEDTPERRSAVLNQAKAIASLAEAVSGYYEKAKLSKEVDDPFRQIVSFEELMTKFNITLDDERFRPGGEFALLNVREYVDEFGRELSEETAHPENFLRWVDERAWFYHDFDPMANIDLFQGMYLIAGSRKVSMYEMLVDFNAYFAHRVPTKGELKILPEDLDRANQMGHFKYADEATQKDKDKGYIGYYDNYVDPEYPEEGEKRAYVSNITEVDEGRRKEVLSVYTIDKEGKRKPVHAVLANKEAWETKKWSEFEQAQEEIMYQLWLQTKNHNADVAYRQEGMPSETPLKETMAKIYSDNIWTRTRRRILGIMDMPATTHRDEIFIEEKDKEGKITLKVVQAPSEAQQRFKGELGHQGSVGKAFQRSLAAYYHIAEANAAFEGYSVEGMNPFFEILKKEGIEGAEVFYKSLIARTLLEDEKFGYVDKKNPEKSKIAVELFNALNDTGIPREGKMQGTFRKRREWEKADFVDLMTLNRRDFLREMATRGITDASLNKAYADLRKKYVQNPTRLGELDAFMQSLSGQSSDVRRTEFVNSLVGQAGITGDEFKKEGDLDAKGKKMKKDGIFYRFLNRPDKNDPMQGLDFLAVGLFTKASATEFTPDINPFINIRYSLESRERMRNAMRDTLSHTEKLDAFDAKWAEEWAYTFAFHTGISARNDMMGIGHDAWSKVLNTEFYRLRQTGGGNYPGNLENLYGIHRLGADFWQGLKVQEDGKTKYDKSLYEVLTGLEKQSDGSYRFNINKDVKSFEFAGNAMRQFYADHVSHAIDLFIDITQKHEFNFDKIVSQDSLGRVIINHGEMQKMIDTTWKHMRYGFDNNGFLYDNAVYSWSYDEKISYDPKGGSIGQVSRTPRFSLMTLRDSMFSHEVQEMGMYKRVDLSGWTAEQYSTKMARNVFAYLIKAQLEEHTKHKERAKLYSADQISLITDAFINYAASVMQGRHGEAVTLSGFFTPEEVYRILVSAHAVLWMLYAKEYGQDALGGFIAAMVQAMQIVMKEVGAGITLK